MELDTAGSFCHRVADDGVCRNGFGFDLSGVAPFQQSEVANINVSRAFCWGTCVDHEDGSSVVNKELCRVVL